MDFLKCITTAHSTYSEGSPLTTSLKLTRGRLCGGWLYFPAGPAGLLHLRGLLGGYQLIPATPGQSYALNDCVVPLHLDHPLSQPPFELRILTWNYSTKYSHTCTLCVFLDPFPTPEARRGFFARLFGKTP